MAIATTTSKDGYGGDKGARNAAYATAQALAARPPGLDPDFPFPMTAFPLSILGRDAITPSAAQVAAAVKKATAAKAAATANTVTGHTALTITPIQPSA